MWETAIKFECFYCVGKFFWGNFFDGEVRGKQGVS